jgi:hypothetical protein
VWSSTRSTRTLFQPDTLSGTTPPPRSYRKGRFCSDPGQTEKAGVLWPSLPTTRSGKSLGELEKRNNPISWAGTAKRSACLGVPSIRSFSFSPARPGVSGPRPPSPRRRQRTSGTAPGITRSPCFPAGRSNYEDSGGPRSSIDNRRVYRDTPSFPIKARPKADILT